MNNLPPFFPWFLNIFLSDSVAILPVDLLSFLYRWDFWVGWFFGIDQISCSFTLPPLLFGSVLFSSLNVSWQFNATFYFCSSFFPLKIVLNLFIFIISSLSSLLLFLYLHWIPLLHYLFLTDHLNSIAYSSVSFPQYPLFKVSRLLLRFFSSPLHSISILRYVFFVFLFLHDGLFDSYSTPPCSTLLIPSVFF